MKKALFLALTATVGLAACGEYSQVPNYITPFLC